MSNVQEQPIVFQQLQHSLQQNRVSHAYIFAGDTGTGKMATAIWLSQGLLCLDATDRPCGRCTNCRRIAEKQHPNVVEIEPDGPTIKVDQIRSSQQFFNQSGVENQQKVLIINQADSLTSSAGNSLLKFIEEPFGKITVIFLTTNVNRMLVTLQSRCQIIHFSPLGTMNLAKQLQTKGYPEDVSFQVARLAGTEAQALEFLKEEWFNEGRTSIQKWVGYLNSKDAYAFIFVQQKIVKLFKDRKQQALFFEMLLLDFRDQLLNLSQTEQYEGLGKNQILQRMKLTIASQKKFNANVSFQNVCEQLTLQLLKR